MCMIAIPFPLRYYFSLRLRHLLTFALSILPFSLTLLQPQQNNRTPKSFYPVDHDVTYECSSQINSNCFTTPTNSDTFINASLITTQVVTIPQDSPFAKSIWRGSCILGQLTPKGAKQQERMGRDLRRIYVDRLGFLPEVFEQEKFFVRSTGRTREEM